MCESADSLYKEGDLCKTTSCIELHPEKLQLILALGSEILSY